MEGSGVIPDHERLDVYQLARELARVGNTVVQQVPSGRADLIDQFRRTTLSIPLNIAEGGGEYAPREKARFYRIAKRSATECVAVIDHIVDLNLLQPAEVESTKTLLRRIIGALVIRKRTAPEQHLPRDRPCTTKEDKPGTRQPRS